jgi:hypothetical protein
MVLEQLVKSVASRDDFVEFITAMRCDLAENRES